MSNESLIGSAFQKAFGDMPAHMQLVARGFIESYLAVMEDVSIRKGEGRSETNEHYPLASSSTSTPNQASDREAFEAWAQARYYETEYVNEGDYYRHPNTHKLYRGWQAARDHYAPKLTAALKVIADFPITSIDNMDAHNMQIIACQTLAEEA